MIGSTRRPTPGWMIGIVLLGLPGLLAGQQVRQRHYPASDKPGELQLAVDFYLWLPPGVERLRGVIVHQHGCGTGASQGGVTGADDLHWQALARKWNCALISPSYAAPDGVNCRLWCDPRNGSDRVFLQALDDFAADTGHAELARVPWCLWGHSGGGFWASLMHVQYPERIVAIWLRSGTGFSYWQQGEIAQPEIPAAAYEVPVMGNPGLKERGHERFSRAWDGLWAMFESYRAEGAAFGFAPDPRTGHECGDSRYLAIPFFDACLAQRLPAQDSGRLRPMDSTKAWLGTLEGEVIQPAAEVAPDEQRKRIWLPNAEFAQAWQAYVRTGSVPDATPPSAPFDVQADIDPELGVVLRWQAHADFESGIRAFVVLRDGQVLAQVPETPAGRFGRPLFQAMSYHDTPEKPLPALRFVDASAQAGRAYRYQVLTINSVELPSAPSEPVRVSR